ncbi:YodC family protein [Paraburkholderia solisilvae]|uniref:DUF2158 domain-containing protein n=1 Tax=Paraburkholderia solisilvae TaxID=624376 RepID=A0A6J5ER19_9BURK|nr:DUF2158 domain-containing protein [Paraburkholderia solisilvae]CAB3767445.1 hypothetical protein LMG29739_05074 [Paraburkholderia solisilvae]
MSASDKFNVGDIVKLVSGGPDMAVKSFSTISGGVFRCQWFAGKKLESGDFAPESLVLVRSVSTDPE